jgi:hypothetical protein
MNWIWCYLDKTLLDSPTYSAGGADRP